MTVLVIIARVEDGLMLSEAMDSADKFPEVEQYRYEEQFIRKSHMPALEYKQRNC